MTDSASDKTKEALAAEPKKRGRPRLKHEDEEGAAPLKLEALFPKRDPHVPKVSLKLEEWLASGRGRSR